MIDVASRTDTARTQRLWLGIRDRQVRLTRAHCSTDYGGRNLLLPSCCRRWLLAVCMLAGIGRFIVRTNLRALRIAQCRPLLCVYMHMHMYL